MNTIRLILVPLCLFSLMSVKAQRCDKKDFCPTELLGDYEYDDQTTYTQMATGDTIRIKTVVYSKYDYRIFVCGERRLGDIEYKIFYPEKRFEPKIDEITKKQVPVYKRDKNGFLIYDDNEEPIQEGVTTINDTLWTRRLVTYTNLVFENNKPESLYWESQIMKTRLMIVEIVVPKSRRYFFGCIAVMVGRVPSQETENIEE
ncbi:MAG: hypothetical protein PHU27_01240 [Salinivirgaceae bacterium]|nr:hypothetical protein [Salinivirgaceae bacterium]MDD4747704.1 hypothetical protein [Salinivirgaceae bacterium]MDY0279263.1 hypothetical protein [Salinivirgaceae bacterium]